MGEFWVGDALVLRQAAGERSDIFMAANYRRGIVHRGAWTRHGRWQEDPYSLKALGDQVFCQGVNRYYLSSLRHAAVDQPLAGDDDGSVGHALRPHQHLVGAQGRAWLQYVARCQYLLQQGRFVADAAYLDGENAPAELRAGDPPLPGGMTTTASTRA